MLWFPFAISSISPLIKSVLVSGKKSNPSVKPQVRSRQLLAWAKSHTVAFDDNAVSALTSLGSERPKPRKSGKTEILSPTPKRILSAKQLLLLLELLRGYADTRVFDKAKRDAEKRSDRARSVAGRLRSLAPKTVEFLWYVDPDYPVWMLRHAENIEGFPNLVNAVMFGDPFSRSFAETTVFLVFATELIKKVTGKPNYRKLADLLNCIALATPSSKPSKQELSAEGIRKAVTRFIERQSEFAEDFLTKDTSEIEKESRVWIRKWHAGERRLRRRKRISPFRQPQSKEAQQGGASVDGGQVGAKEGKE